MLLIDHLFIVILVIVHPVVGYLSFHRLLRRVAAGEPVKRADLYTSTMTSHWLLFIAALSIWGFSDRGWDVLGFGPMAGSGFWAAVALSIVAIFALVMQMRLVTNGSDEAIHRFRGQLGKLEFLLPRNGNELARFYAVSVTAGIVEETLWRGLVIWYFSQFLPLWVAALISLVGFALAHAYQGIENVPKIGLVSALFVALFLLSGSLWLPMVMHAAVDIVQGRIAYNIMRRTSDYKPQQDKDDQPAASGVP